MKAIRLALSLIVGMFMLSSCVYLEEVSSPVTEGEACTVRFRIGGAAATRTAAEANESRVNSILACLFNVSDNSEYYVVEAKPVGSQGEWEIKVPKDLEYGIVFIANADAETRKALEDVKLPEGYHSFSQVGKVIKSVVTNQICDGDEFIMECAHNYTITPSIAVGPKDLGTIKFIRIAARFDIVNKAEGITINKVTFNNRVIKSTITSPDNWEADDAWYEEKVYDNLNIAGDRDEEKAGKLLHEIYSYRNLSNKENGKLPTLTIEYTETGDDGSSVVRSHTVEFIDPDKDGKTPLPIYGNRLYTITLTKAFKINFDLKVSDWEEGEEFGTNNFRISDLDIPSEEQQRLNALLKVNRFTGNNVKSLDLNTKEAELFTELTCDLNDYSTGENGAYCSYNALNSAGLTADDAIITDKNTGDKYRLPTAGELMLLFPYPPEVFEKDYSRETFEDLNGGNSGTRLSFLNNRVSLSDAGDYTALFAYTREWREKISLKDRLENDKYYYQIPDDQDKDCFITQFEGVTPMRVIFDMYLNGTNLVAPNTTGGVRYVIFDAYALRFEGSSEYAAYKYEIRQYGEDYTTGYYLNIKIKAIPQTVNISISDITENDEYWSKDYIEYKIPFTGSISVVTRNETANCSVLSKTLSNIETNKVLTGGQDKTRVQMWKGDKDTKYSMRLVKVED